MLYMVTFAINIPPRLAYILYHTWILWVAIQSSEKFGRLWDPCPDWKKTPS